MLDMLGEHYGPLPNPLVIPNEGGVRAALKEAASAAVVIKASGVGIFDEFLEREVLDLQSAHRRVVFWDVDAPATLERVQRHLADPFRALIPRYDFILTYGGGEPVVEAYRALGASRCVPIYNALDPDTHHPTSSDSRFEAELGFLANRLPDREARVEEFFLRAAAALPGRRFLLGGAGWGDKPMPANVKNVGHVYTSDHNAFNSTPHAALNVCRESMARTGYSPATRVFEAAGAGACLITDAWAGIEMFLEPGREVLVAQDGVEVAQLVESLTPERSRTIGDAARQRVLAEHTYDHRAEQLESLLGEGSRPPRGTALQSEETKPCLPT